MINFHRLPVVALAVGLIFTSAPARARRKCEVELSASPTGRQLYGACNWTRLAGVDRATDAAGRPHYLFRTSDGGVQVYRANEPDRTPGADARALTLVPIDARGRPGPETLVVAVEEHLHRGFVVETWTFRRQRRDVVLTFCDPADARAAMPDPINYSS